jgi:glutamate dehydrogenase
MAVMPEKSEAQSGADLLAEAAKAAPVMAGDVHRFLTAYYRHVAADELAAAGPDRIAAVAAAHAQVAANRPQGRAVVQVRRGGEAALDPAADVIDIVTDDMPFLVDSISMELARHDLPARLVIHPQLRVRRDLTGALVEVVGKVNGDREPSHDELPESWTHLEVATTGAGEAAAITADLHRVLSDVRAAVEDYTRMRARGLALADELMAAALTRAGREAAESADAPAEIAELLRWLADGHLTFLGYREYDLSNDGMQLRAVPGSGLGVLRHDRPGPGAFGALPPEVRARARDPQRLIMTKANSRSTVHRPSYLDYVGVKRLNEAGMVVGEYRFLGLFTHAALSETIRGIPVLRRKLGEVLDSLGYAAESHDGKEAVEVLDSYPREELFMTPVEDLAEVCAGVHRLRERRETRLFLRRDVYGRYVSGLVYMPRDRYNTQVRLRVTDALKRAFGTGPMDYSVLLGDSLVARLHIVVRAERGEQLPEMDPAELQRQVAAAVRSWDDDLADEAARELGPQRARELMTAVGDTIPETYKTDVPAPAAVGDFIKIMQMRADGHEVAFDLWESEDYVGGVPIGSRQDGPVPGAPGTRVWRLTIYSTGGPITLTDVLPRLQHMGVDVVDEHPYEFTTTADADAAADSMAPFRIYDFGLRRAGGADADAAGGAGAGQEIWERGKHLVEGALAALWAGLIDDDGFNALVLDAQLNWRQVVMLRAYARYLRQANGTFSQEYIERVLRSNAAITRLLVQLFEARFDPDAEAGRTERTAAIADQVTTALDGVASLDEDRILRCYLGLITATLRTNYFAAADDAAYLVVKLDAGQVAELPAPRPRFELFVYSPRFEGVHLRFASVARGGLRWSDRREDFRTEILGLAKAQEVKNSVIVPSGAKGGFVCKQLPDPADREAHFGEVLACYRMFISAMLDVTDNLEAGVVVPPDRVVRHDGDDPYLVVAADKGTATFSDTANEIATGRGFWLGDAFASGGSAGYDHKKMGITARGAWESVRFHFRTLGVSVDDDDFTALGIGDMSGDVFGNGMLLSRHIRLVAAFDHRHVFVDPSPDPEASYAERQRLFRLPRSSWADYDATLISAGGGVYPRSAKTIPISPQARAALGLADGSTVMSPDSLIAAILAAPVDLLWNGGIGTYVKASNQSHADVGDRSNDAVRIDATQLRAKVVGEGGNLGLTQEARVEYALAGGLVNTDFIDNSAGVDTSDHEVNIKILLEGVVRDGELTRADRDALLFQMTDEVAGQVLEHNYQQNRTLAAARDQAAQMLHVHARYIRKLERDGLIRRKLDVLPNDREIAERRSAGAGLVTPEFSVLLAHTKIAAAREVLDSGLPDEPYLRRVLIDYFPTPLRQNCVARMGNHRLHREIITTVVVNDMVDRSGTTFIFRLNEETGASVPEITAAWLVARAVFDMPGFWSQVEALNGTVDTSVQLMAVLEGRKLTERAARWLLHNRRPPFDVQSEIGYFGDGVLTVAADLPKLLAGRDLTGFEERREIYDGRGVPTALAERIAAMVPAYSAFDIVDIARDSGRSVEETAEVYFDLADRLQIARLRDMITALPRDDRWSTMARAALRDDLYAAHAALARDVLTVTDPGSPEERLAAWEQRNDSAVRRASQTLTEIWESNAFTVATLSVAVRAVRTLVTASTLPTNTV